MNIEFTSTPASADIDFLTQKINQETPEFGKAHPFAFFIRDEKNQIIAGCNGSVIFGSIYTDQLWVHPNYRKNGLGHQLMEAVLLAEKEHIQIIGLNGLELIATAVLVPEGQNCKMQRVVVKEDLTNNGIGSRMMIFCEDVAKKNGFKKLYCHARATAVEFYFKSGYEAQGDYFDEDFIPHLKMNKVL